MKGFRLALTGNVCARQSLVCRRPLPEPTQQCAGARNRLDCPVAELSQSRCEPCASHLALSTARSREPMLRSARLSNGGRSARLAGPQRLPRQGA